MADIANRIRGEFAKYLDRVISIRQYDRRVRNREGRRIFFFNAFKTLSYNGIEGDYAEFGCCGCRTFGLAYAESRKHSHNAKLWAFDSFEGLPPPKDERDEHPVWVEGTMRTELDQFHNLCKKRGIPRNCYEVVPGFYNESLPKLTQEKAPDRIALAYIDCDLYSSTVDVLDFLWPRLRHGMIIAFDDYFCYSDSELSGERRAMLERFPDDCRWRLLPYMQFGWHGQSFIVEDSRLYPLPVSVT